MSKLPVFNETGSGFFTFLRVAQSIVNPFGGSQTLVVGPPIEEAGVDVQREEQVGGGSDHPETTQRTR